MGLKQILINDLIDLEGGYSNRPSDAGGETKYGITKAVALQYGYTGLIKDISRDLATDIYEKKYWKPLKLDNFVSLGFAVLAREIFDIGVNCGISRAAEFLQRCLNVFNNQGKYYPDLLLDGSVGDKTINAFKSFMVLREGKGGEKILLRALNCLQGAHYLELAEKRQKDESNVYGWFDKRIVL